MKQADIARATLDPRLTPAALRVVLDVARRGPGEHEIPFSHFRSLIQAGEKVVRREVALAVEREWISRQPGGQGKSDVFAFTPAESATLLEREEGYPGNNGRAMSTYPGKSDRSNPHSPADSATLTPPHARDAVAVADEDGGNPPIVPPSLTEKAAAALDQHADLLQGCRGALRDYLKAHVSPERQYGYIQTVATWLDGHGFVWRDTSGSNIPAARRPGLIAAALNELDAEGETPMKYEEGNPRNLKTKLSILSKPIQRRSHGGASTSTDERAASGHRSGFVIEE